MRKSNKFKLIKFASIFIFLILILYFLITTQHNKIFFKKILNILPQQTLCKDCNIIFVSLDTLSANHLQCYGYERQTAPNLCSFAEKNIFFENTYSNAPWTLPSHVSIFTGLYPFRHGVNKSLDVLEKNITLLPELLKSNGYNVLFFIPKNDISLPIRGVYEKINDGLYDNNIYDWSKSIEMFKQSVRNNKKTFMFLHTYATHSPYIIEDRKPIYQPVDKNIPVESKQIFNNFSPEFIDFFLSETRKGIENNIFWQLDHKTAEKLFLELELAYPNYSDMRDVLVKMKESNNNLLYDYEYFYNYLRKINPKNSENVEALKALYDQTINILDIDKIPLLTNLIESPEFKDNTILIIFSDHGEEFMEHNHLWHETIYNSNIKVPLVMHIPNLNNKKISNSVQLVDVFPTLTEIVGIKTDISFDGKSLIENIIQNRDSNKLIITDGWGLESKSLIYNEWKLFLLKQENRNYIPYELYNLNEDPDEKHNILFENIDIKNEMLEKYLKL